MKNYNPFSLVGKTILVTGASSGIGHKTAIECSKLGAQVVITARNEERLKTTFKKLEGEGHQMLIANITDTDQIESLVTKLPKLDGFSCNAGIANTQPIGFYKEEEIENVFKTNTFSMMMFTKFLVKKKKLNKPSSIVYTASIGNVFSAGIANGIYGASKCAIDGFMRTAAVELASKGIRCNSVNPGMVYTSIMDTNSRITKEQFEEDMKKYPLGRYGSPEDIAFAIIYLLSDASAWVTGTALKIDGGITI
ncbi:MAG: SDR family NAD(P)-dependent oxidoreductase [Clostridia bacterium]|nr:SDR family NAD(P)-dependent oxidoreductase [Clostridia bacterium]